MQIFPAIDLRGGQVVRLYQGDYDQETVYAAEPDCFTTCLEATVVAHLYAVTTGEEPVFTDFILKGEIV